MNITVGGRDLLFSEPSSVFSLIVEQGLTDRFKAKDVQFRGSATLDYETFMQMVLPFIVA